MEQATTIGLDIAKHVALISAIALPVAGVMV
jgi:hypothetical protein